MRHRTPDLALAATLLIIGVALIVCFTVAAAGTSHLALSSSVTARVLARYRAESAVAEAISRLNQDVLLGSTRTTEMLRYVADESEPVAVLTFNRAKAEGRGWPFATNNVEGVDSVPGWDGRDVPKECVHLVAQGRQGSVRVVVEALLTVPRFPYAIASSGPFISNGGLLVASVLKASDATHPDKLMPGHLASNSAANRAVVLGPGTRVKGDVQTRGQLKKDPDAVVKGEIRLGGDAVSIPDMDVREFDPKVRDDSDYFDITVANMHDSVVEGFARRQGSLTVTGGLQLRNGVLFVEGDLNISGGLAGLGAVIVTGKTTLQGGASLASDNLVALISEGDVQIHGDGEETSAFRGLVYTGGRFKADDITLLGNFVVNGAENNDTDGTVTVRNVRLIQAPDLLSVSFKPTVTKPAPASMPRFTHGRGRRAAFRLGKVRLMVHPSVQDEVFFDGTSNRFRIEDVDREHQRFTFDIRYPDGTQFVTDSLDQAIGRLGADPTAVRRGVDQRVDELLEAQRKMYERLNAELSRPTDGRSVERVVRETAGTDNFTFDFNEFIRRGENVQVLMWRTR